MSHRDTILYPEYPKDFPRNDTSVLAANWKYSRDLLIKISDALRTELRGQDDITIAVAGSFGRMEASLHSDFDYMILANKSGEPMEKVKEVIEKVAAGFGLNLPNPEGVF
jgi:hypothetical protein